MSHCPQCQRAPQRPDFCDHCFRPFSPLSKGLFQELLTSSPPQDSVTVEATNPGLDLTSVNYQPSPWSVRVLQPMLKMGAIALLLCALGGAALMIHSSHRRSEAKILAQSQLQQCALLVQEKKLNQAYPLAAEALASAERSAEADLMSRAHQNLAKLADSQGEWSEGSLHFARALELVKTGDDLKAALQKLDVQRCQVAASLVQRARKAMSAKDYLKALQLSSAATYLLDVHHGKNLQQADCHFLNAQLYYRTGLRTECLAKLDLALQANSKHRGALALRKELTPKPAPADRPPTQIAAPNVVLPVAEEEFIQPQLMPGSAYPTHQSKRKSDRDRDQPRRRESPTQGCETSPVRSYRPPTPTYRAPKSTYKPPRRSSSSSRSTTFKSPTFQAPTFRSP